MIQLCHGTTIKLYKYPNGVDLWAEIEWPKVNLDLMVLPHILLMTTGEMLSSGSIRNLTGFLECLEEEFLSSILFSGCLVLLSVGSKTKNKLSKRLHWYMETLQLLIKMSKLMIGWNLNNHVLDSFGK